MAGLAKYRQLIKEFGAVADFLVVYIEEAHPTDGFYIAGTVDIPSHRNVKDRLAAARYLLELEPLNCPVVVDSEEGPARELYTAMPERLFIILEGHIVFHGGPGPLQYKMEEVEQWLAVWKNSHPQ
ncbi:Iodothyronine deiodinase [Trinorchestia longiramus]|nr:Iodothyronine deiodinase [Trinorchestia longiramus]